MLHTIVLLLLLYLYLYSVLILLHEIYCKNFFHYSFKFVCIIFNTPFGLLPSRNKRIQLIKSINLSLTDVDSKVEFLTNTLTSAYDTHAPYRTCVDRKKTSSWINPSIKRLISLRNKAWRDFKRDGRNSSRSRYKVLRNHVQILLRNAKFDIFKQRLTSCHNSTHMWKILNGLSITDTVAASN